MRVAVIAATGWVVGCWADFPDDRAADGRPPMVDGPIAGDSRPADTGGQSACDDGDGDGHRACEGDCNDADDRVFPGQKVHFDEAAAGSFDYDCNGEQELEIAKIFEGCQRVEEACEGSGWRDDVPGCGEEAKLVVCERRGDGCRQRERDRRQACR